MAIESATSTLFSIFRGDDVSFKVTVKDSNDVPVDITDWSFKTTLKINFMEDDDSATVAVDNLSLSGDDAVAGFFYITLPHAQTKNLLPANYFFDIQSEIGGYVSTVISGRVRVNADTTHRET